MPFVDANEKLSSFVPDDNPSLAELEQEQGNTTGFFKTLSSSMGLWFPSTSLVVNDATLSVFDDYDPDFTPEDHMEGFEDYRDILSSAKDATHMQRLKGDILRNKRMEDAVASAGTMGVVTGLAVNVLDPIGFFTFGAAGSLAKGSRVLATTKLGKAAHVTVAGARTAGAGAASIAVSEAVLQATQPSLRAEESIKAIGFGAILGGFIGSGVKFLDIKQFNSLGKRVKADFEKVHRTAQRVEELNKATAKAYADSVGAAAVKRLDAKDLELVDTFGMARLTSKISPTLRIMTGTSEVAKNVYLRLAEVPLKIKGNNVGEVTPLSAETAAKDFDRPLADAVRATTKGYKQVKKEFKDQGQKLSNIDYRRRLSSALRRNDEDIEGNESITSIAKDLRSKFFDPIKNEAIRVGLFPEDIQAKFADSYLTRMWNPKAILENLPVFRERLGQWAEKKVKEEIGRVEENFNNSISRLENNILKEEQAINLANERLNQLSAAPAIKFDYKDLASVQDDYLEFLKRDIGLQEVGAYLARFELEDAAVLVNSAKASIPPMPQGLASEIVKRGGIKPDADLTTMGFTNKSRVGLLRQGGQSLDVMMRDLIDDGFFGHYKENPNVPSKFMEDDLRQSLFEDVFGEGVYRDADYAKAVEIQNLEALKEEALQILGAQGIDHKNFYKNIFEDIRASKRDLRKATKEEKARLKAAREAGREAQAKTKNLRTELKRYRNAEAASLRRGIKKSNTRIKKMREKADDLSGQKTIALDAFFDVDDAESVAQYVDEAVDEITNNLTGLSPRPDLPPYIAPVARGPLKEKLLDVQDVDFEDFLENDIQAVMQYYRHHMGSQIELKRNFGSIDLKDQIDDINQDFNARIKLAETAKERNKLAKEQLQTVRDIEGVRDLLLGNFNRADPDEWYNQAATVLKDLQYMAKLGGVTISSFPDVARTMMVSGLDNAFPNFKGKQLAKTIKGAKTEELQEAGLLLETVLASRLQSLADIGDPLNRGTALTRFTGNAAQLFTKVTLINNWNDIQKSYAALAGQRRLLKGLSSTKRDEIAFLRTNGIDEFHANIIKEQVAKHGGGDLSGLKYWDTSDPNVHEAARLWRGALRKISDITVVTKGAGDLPLVANTVGGRLLLQFKTFLIASHSRILLRSLQARGSKEATGAMLGVVSSVAMGMAVASIKAELYNRSAGLRGSDSNFDVSDWNKRKWLVEGLDRSGLVAMMLEPINIADKATGIGPSLFTGQGQTSRYASRNVLGALLGPTAGTVGDAAISTRALASPITGADISKSDIYAFRRIMPFQNAFIFRQMFDILEQQAGEALNAK